MTNGKVRLGLPSECRWWGGGRGLWWQTVPRRCCCLGKRAVTESWSTGWRHPHRRGVDGT